ncbi:hypothetical protein [Halorubrum halodurans]|uniref:Uncharacterized protein n=1 Tax=Halorubrum halodurans TaxID=1383851 RepID=A0A256IJE2_9EURY|nr:hypothetical protein [Halorubrum halodurans]OYR56660.1 hypothetical protein DJ70_08060 [Halorubrum halodurans]
MTRHTNTTDSPNQDDSGEIHFTNQELGQLHRLMDLTNHYLTWCEVNDPDTDTYEYDTIQPDWTHLNELPAPSETSDDTYNPDLDEYRDIGVIPINFLAEKHDIRNAVTTLADTITNELTDTTDNTKPRNPNTPGTPNSARIETTATSGEHQQTITAYTAD